MIDGLITEHLIHPVAHSHTLPHSLPFPRQNNLTNKQGFSRDIYDNTAGVGLSGKVAGTTISRVADILSKSTPLTTFQTVVKNVRRISEGALAFSNSSSQQATPRGNTNRNAGQGQIIPVDSSPSDHNPAAAAAPREITGDNNLGSETDRDDHLSPLKVPTDTQMMKGGQGGADNILAAALDRTSSPSSKDTEKPAPLGPPINVVSRKRNTTAGGCGGGGGGGSGSGGNFSADDPSSGDEKKSKSASAYRFSARESAKEVRKELLSPHKDKGAGGGDESGRRRGSPEGSDFEEDPEDSHHLGYARRTSTRILASLQGVLQGGELIGEDDRMAQLIAKVDRLQQLFEASLSRDWFRAHQPTIAGLAADEEDIAQEQALLDMKPFRVASLMAVEAAAKALAQRDRRGSKSHDRVGNDSNHGRSGGGLSMFTPQSRKSGSPHSNNSPRSPQASGLQSGQRSVFLTNTATATPNITRTAPLGGPCLLHSTPTPTDVMLFHPLTNRSPQPGMVSARVRRVKPYRSYADALTVARASEALKQEQAEAMASGLMGPDGVRKPFLRVRSAYQLFQR